MFRRPLPPRPAPLRAGGGRASLVVRRGGSGLMLVSCPQDFERDEDRSANGGSESDGEENIGWSTVNLDEEKQHQDVRRGGAGGRRAGTTQPGGLRGFRWQHVTRGLRASLSEACREGWARRLGTGGPAVGRTTVVRWG